MLAAVDIGTNTLLLLIAERRGDALVAVHQDCRFGRLGQGLDQSGRLDGEAIARSLAALRDYRAEIDRRGVERIAAVGTQALREASNAAEFLAPARDILGADIEVIAGDREAELVHAATVRSFPELARGELIVADVGGGSTEVIVGDGDGVRSRTSLPIGSVRMTERYLAGDPPTAEQARAMTGAIDAALGELSLPAGAPVVGTAGTATALVAVEHELDRYDPDRVHGVRLSAAAIERQLARYLSLTVAERRELRGLEPERADVIAAGAAIFARLLVRAGTGAMTVSDRGVRWGLAYQAM